MQDSVTINSASGVEKCIPSVTYNLIESSISFNEANLGTNRGAGNGDVNSIMNDHSHDKIQGDENADVYSIINKLRIENINRVIIAHLNINSLRNKFDMLADIMAEKIDILCISETKLNESFPSSNFTIRGYSPPYRRDRTDCGGGIMIFVRNDIPSKELTSINIPEGNECLFIEINLYKKKWLIGNFYNPSKNLIKDRIKFLGKCLDHYLPSYDNLLILGDFNSEISEPVTKAFCEIYNLKNLVKENTCFKNPDNPSCIDLILTNRYRSFQNTHVIETGLSDFHKMTVTVLKTFFEKKKPKIISYRDYKSFTSDNFIAELEANLYTFDLDEIKLEDFENIFMDIFDKHAPIKYKYLRANDAPFMNKELRKEVMLRSKLKNIHNKDKSAASNRAYKRQRNLCTKLFRKAKKDFYAKLNPSFISDNKTFWKTVKPFFSDKKTSSDNITLVVENKIISEDRVVAETFNTYFVDAVKSLNINIDPELLENSDSINDPICEAIQKYKKHPSILKIKGVHADNPTFSFSDTTKLEMKKEIGNISRSKASPLYSIPAKVIKENSDFFANLLYNNFNNCVRDGSFPNNLKLADLTPGHKNGARQDKTNYRPISILSTISKLYERILYSQINNGFNDILSIYQCGFRKGFSTQHCLIAMLEKWKTSIDKGGYAGALLTDLSKAFDCISYDLLIAKLDAYGFGYNSLKFIHSYLNNRYQRVRINSTYSSWSEIKCGVPQGSILGPLLFNIYMCDLFLFVAPNIANYADDNTPYATCKDTQLVITQLENDAQLLLQWMANNAFKANPDKSYLLLNSRDNDLLVEIDGHEIFNSEHVKLLGITIDNELKFNKHVSNLCKKASQKLHALCRISQYMSMGQKRLIMKAFIQSQFGYCPLVWIFHSRELNTRINRIHERALRIVYNDDQSSFNALLDRDKSFTVHERNIQTLAIEMFKVINGLSPEIMKRVFPLKSNPMYCTGQIFKTRNVRSVYNGLDTLSFLGPKIWLIIPDDIRSCCNITEFKRKIRKWKPLKCPCRLCKIYIPGVGYVQVQGEIDKI